MKFRVLIAVYAAIPLSIFFATGIRSGIFHEAPFQLAASLSLAAYIVIIFSGPLLGLNWLFLRQFQKITVHCQGIRRGKYQYFSLPNQPTHEDEENELITLMRNMNWMTRQISGRESELEERVRRRTIELEKTNEELVIAKEGADASVRAKDEFLAAMSHEIRTPMNAIIGLSELLSRSELSERRREQLQTIYSSSNALLGILNDILDYSKINAGKMDLEQIHFCIRKTVREVHEMFMRSADEKGISLELIVDPDLPRCLIGDPNRIRQVLVNLVSNAVKFTANGSVEISVKGAAAREGMVRLQFQVSDTGIGMSERTIAGIFDPFTQADSSTTRRYGGTGLGMAICHRIAGLMGGTIRVESSEGSGSIFYFSVTLPSDEMAVEKICAVCEPVSIVGQCSVLPMRVLVADDNPVNLEVASEILLGYGVQSDCVDGGEAALVALQSGSYDIVLMDIHMDGMDGYEATRLIRQKPEFESLPVIALSASAMLRDRERAVKSGMNDFLAKPIDSKTLFEMLKKWKGVDMSVPVCVNALAAPFSQNDEAEILPGIDLNDARTRLGTKYDSLKRLIVSYASSYQNSVEELQQVYLMRDWKELAFLLHKLKGGAGNISAMPLVKALEMMEAAVNGERDPETTGVLLESCKHELNLILDTGRRIESEDRFSVVGDRREPDWSRDRYADVFRQLSRLYRSKSLQAKKAFLEAREGLASIGYEDEIRQLGSATCRFDFIAAEAILNSISLKMNISLEE